jgi:putative ABC transport system permease protein
VRHIALASIRRQPVLFIGLFITITVAATFVTIAGHGFLPEVTSGTDSVLFVVWALILVIALLVALMGVTSGTNLSIALRRREFALLRLNGASPGQLQRLILGETAILAVLASSIGVGIGAFLANLTVGYLDRIMGAEVEIAPTPIVLLIAFFVVVIAAVVAAGLGSRRAARIEPADAMREASMDQEVMPKRRWIFGVVILVAGIAIYWYSFVSTGTVGGQNVDNVVQSITFVLLASFLLTLAAVFFAPALVPMLGRAVLSLAIRISPSAVPRIAIGTIVTARRRTASLASPIIASIGILCSFATMQATHRALLDADDVAVNQAIIAGVTAASLLFAVISVASSQAVTYSARGSELGAMRLLGISRKSIMWIAFAETVAIGLLGILVGLVLSGISAAGYYSSLVRELGPGVPFALPWAQLGLIGGSVLLALIISGLISATRLIRSK